MYTRWSHLGQARVLSATCQQGYDLHTRPGCVPTSVCVTFGFEPGIGVGEFSLGQIAVSAEIQSRRKVPIVKRWYKF